MKKLLFSSALISAFILSSCNLLPTTKKKSSSTSSSGESSNISTTNSGSNQSSSGTSSSSLLPDVPGDKYTILLYICGSDLESNYAEVTEYYDPYTRETYEFDGKGMAVSDISEILAVPNKPDGLNIVIATGGSSKWTKNSTYGHYSEDYDIRNDKIQYHHVYNGKIYLDQTLSQASMGSASTLTSFLNYGFENYPAEKYGVILWNHGAGMGGVCVDENKDDDRLTNAEVQSAISSAKSTSHISDKLEWIGYDACLMGVADIAATNATNFNYMVASEELEPGAGWDYDGWLPTLYQNLDVSTPTLLSKICSTFVKESAEDFDNPSDNDATLGVYDLSKADAFITEFNDWSANFTTQTQFNNLKTIYKSSLRFGDQYHGDEYLYGAVDAVDFLNNIKKSSSFSSIDNTKLLASINDMVVTSEYGQYYSSKSSKPCGITMFFAGDETVGSYPPQISRTNYTESDSIFAKWRKFNLDYGTFYDDEDNDSGWGDWSW